MERSEPILVLALFSSRHEAPAMSDADRLTPADPKDVALASHPRWASAVASPSLAPEKSWRIFVAERLVKHLEESNFVIDHHNWLKSAATKLVLRERYYGKQIRQNGRYIAYVGDRERLP
jgi:hypothetical protein